MHYVVLEVEVAHREDRAKDWVQIARFEYQFLDAKTLKPVFEENRHVELGPGCSLQEAVGQLDADIAAHAGEDFVLCSLGSTWHFRVTMPRQARDEVFILPPHLQHPKVFDLWKEYQRWCVNHPEVLALRKTTCQNKRAKDLNELRAVLELDFVSDAVSDAVSTEHGETSATAVTPATPPQPETPLDQTVAVIIQLHQKCSTPEDKLMVLTHPYDSYLDVRTFLQERSKVLYMNNLPPDTTQSELESWFTQFGARPVGFWTVRNIVEETSNVNNNWSSNNSTYVEAEDSISGFVVFQSHEEATEALSLNGRSILSNIANTKQPRVIEHTVEIQPSSARVLDRAQEILSPFPQSKNKPRPGDWNCPSCGFSNFQRRTSCFRCSFPATDSNGFNKGFVRNPLQQPGLNDLQTGYKLENVANGIPSIPGQMTGQLMQQMHPSQQQQQQHHQSQHHQQRVRYNQGQRFGQNQHSGSNVPFRAGDWKCAVCTYHNFAKNVVCLRCGGPKTTEHQQKDLGSVNSYNMMQEIDNGIGVSLNTRSFSEPAW
ncbi:LAME_0B07140g1_1 [Lachancea meyersii CBS 8951]|uniref:LAME_0B07140g1_1 n=1 Tax=Lachancea meyersii CBS 8951 TaxID=1266667 RepID=A0A1G4IWN4_9SACH|nr:LAME_0B07140g1_1 [Lachancea meyersii CBS 8951]